MEQDQIVARDVPMIKFAQGKLKIYVVLIFNTNIFVLNVFQNIL